jgi:Transglutaminase-like superfamily
MDAYGTLRTPDVLRPGVTYSVVSYLPNLSADELRKVNSTSVPGDMRGSYYDTGSLSPRAMQLAKDATKFVAGNEFDEVMALTNFLQTHYRYSQQLGHVPPGTDPVDYFLFDSLIGYCEQFATAETLMLRSLGIPARLATGYSTGSYDPVLDQAVVREHDAHAWVEVYFGQYGWVPVDPSPGFSALAATQFPNHWAAGGIARLIPHLTIGAPVAALNSLGVLAAIPGALAISFVVVLLYAWIRSRRRPAARAAPGESELLRLYDRLQRRIGRRRAPPETPLEYLRGANAGSFEAVLNELTEAVNAGAYAGRWPDRSRVKEWSDRLI